MHNFEELLSEYKALLKEWDKLNMLKLIDIILQELIVREIEKHLKKPYEEE